MSKSKYRKYPDDMKSYLPFHFPYETDGVIQAGLEDEVSSETWSYEGVRYTDYKEPYYQIQAYNPVTHPQRLYAQTKTPYGYVVGTNNSRILNLNSSGDYEIEIYATKTNAEARE